MKAAHGGSDARDASPGWPLVGLALSLFLPSTAIVQKYLGVPGVVLYLVAASLALYLGYRYVFGALISGVPERAVPWLAGAFFLALSIVFFVVYPLADSGAFGAGSDRDEALDIAVRRLLDGEYPYYGRTYLDNPISPMPGAALLAFPFVLLGTSAYQNLFWLPVFFLAMRPYLGDGRRALLLLCVIFASSPIVLQEFVTGGDLLANAIYVLLFAMWTVHSASGSDDRLWKWVIPAVLLGIGLSSRANMVFLLPLVFFAIAYSDGWRAAIRSIVVACIAFAAVTAPFFLYDPQGFTPLQTTNRFSQFEATLPLVGLVVPLLTAVLALLLALRRENRDLRILLRNCAILLAAPVMLVVILSSISSGSLEFALAGQGIPFLVFGAVASWATLFGRKEASRA